MSDASPLSVVLMAGGYGTRLYPLTKDCPKALLPLGRSSVILDHILRGVQDVPGVEKIVLVSNHAFFPKFDAWKRTARQEIELLDDGSFTNETRLGAIRDLDLALQRIPEIQDALVLGTDNLFEWSLADFVQFGKIKRPACTMAIREAPSLEEASRCAVLDVDDRDRVVRCVEKPAQPFSRIVGLCVYYIPAGSRHRVGEFMQGGGNVDAPGYFIEWLVKQDAVYGFMTSGDWFDIGSQETYRQVVERWGS